VGVNPRRGNSSDDGRTRVARCDDVCVPVGLSVSNFGRFSLSEGTECGEVVASQVQRTAATFTSAVNVSGKVSNLNSLTTPSHFS